MGHGYPLSKSTPHDVADPAQNCSRARTPLGRDGAGSEGDARSSRRAARPPEPTQAGGLRLRQRYAPNATRALNPQATVLSDLAAPADVMLRPGSASSDA